MKKVLVSSILILFSIPLFASAATFNPVSPLDVGLYQTIVPTCTVGNTIEIYQADVWVSELENACNGIADFSFLNNPLTVGTYQIVEWNSLVQMSDPTTQSLQATEADPAFVSVELYTLFDPAFLSPSTFISSTRDTLVDISTTGAYVITSILALIGLFIAGGWSWNFLKRHVGQPISGPTQGARKMFARRAYLSETDDRSDRGDFLHEGS